MSQHKNMIIICSRCKRHREDYEFYRKGNIFKTCNDCNEYIKKYEKMRRARNLNDRYKRCLFVYMLSSAKSRAKKRGVPFDIDKEYLKEIMPEGWICPVFGIKMEINKDKCRDNSPSLDCLVPELGYIKGNVFIISHKANTMKSSGNVEELEKIIEYIKQKKDN